MNDCIAATVVFGICVISQPGYSDPGVSYQSNNVTIEVDPIQQKQLDMLTNIYEALKPKEEKEGNESTVAQPGLVDSMESYKGKPPAWMTKKRNR